jgi:hypothetical protein
MHALVMVHLSIINERPDQGHGFLGKAMADLTLGR